MARKKDLRSKVQVLYVCVYVCMCVWVCLGVCLCECAISRCWAVHSYSVLQLDQDVCRERSWEGVRGSGGELYWPPLWLLHLFCTNNYYVVRLDFVVGDRENDEVGRVKKGIPCDEEILIPCDARDVGARRQRLTIILAGIRSCRHGVLQICVHSSGMKPISMYTYTQTWPLTT
jgi:hypothetical protein